MITYNQRTVKTTHKTPTGNGNRKKLHYTACGLDNVFLMGDFNPDSYAIVGLDQLHRCIATTLINKKQILSGKEFRFIRKELNLTQKDFADKIGADVQAVSRWEKGDAEKGSVYLADRVIRILYLLNSGVSSTDVNTFLDRLSRLDVEPERDLVFKVANNSEWSFTDSKKIA